MGQGGRPVARVVRRRLGALAAGMAIALLVLAALVALGSPVVRAETSVDASVGVNGHADPTGSAMVRVRVAADELVDGRVEITRDGSSIVVRQDVQVPAGTTKDLLLLVPGPFFEGSLTVDVRDGDRLVATRDVRVRFDEDAELVGVLPRLVARGAELPDQATLDSGVGRAELAALPLDVVDRGPAALQAYDTIAGTGDDLAGMDDDQRRSLLLWVNAGGRLLLDDAGGVDALPEAWRPGAAGYSWAGTGEVRLVDGAASRGEWGSIVEPSQAATSMLTEMVVGPESDLARRAGLRLPTLTPVIVTLAAYGLVVGPVAYLLLRRARRLTLGWVLIPLVAVLTAGGVVVAGGRYRSSGHPAMSSFLDVSPAGALAVTNVLAFDRGGGATTVVAPAGWTLDQRLSMWMGGQVGASRVMTDDGGAVTLTMSLEAGQVATETMSGPAAGAELAVTATLRPGGMVGGTVVNGTDGTLREVAVFVGSEAVALGDVAAGATVPWTTRAPRHIDRFRSRGEQVWDLPFEVGLDGRDAVAEFGIWGAASGTLDLFAPGLARAVGWSDDVAPVLELGEDTSTRTALSATTPVAAGDQPLAAGAVRASVVRTPFGMFGDGMGTEQVYRYLLPPDAVPQRLRLSSVERESIDELAVWDGSGWVTLDLEDEPVAAVPADAVRAGVVLVRATLRGGMEPSSLPVLEETT